MLWLGLFHEVLPPGTAVIMTLEANLQTVHGVPAVGDYGMGTGFYYSVPVTCTPGEFKRIYEHIESMNVRAGRGAEGRAFSDYGRCGACVPLGAFARWACWRGVCSCWGWWRLSAKPGAARRWFFLWSCWGLMALAGRCSSPARP